MDRSGNKERTFYEHELATFMAEEKFEERHPKEEQPEWLERYTMIDEQKIGEKKWIVKRSLFYVIELGPDQHWEKDPRGGKLLIETDPITGERYVIFGGSTNGNKVLFEAEVDLDNGTVIVLTDTDLDLLDERDYFELFPYDLYHPKRAQLTIIWRDKISRNKQIILLKRLYPKLRELSSAQIYEMACKNEGQWKFAEMGWESAADLKDEAAKLGLDIVLEEIE